MKKKLLSVGLICLPFLSQASVIGYKGDILFFTDDPTRSADAVNYYPDGVLLVQDGHVLDAGKFDIIKSKYNVDKVVDYTGKIITPGFIDLHVHYPQMEMTGKYGKQLIDWLNEYTFPTEEKYGNYDYASRMSDAFLNALTDNGTTTALVFATSNVVSVDAFFDRALKKNMRMISGKVLMDRNAPAPLLDTPETAYSESRALIEKWHNKGRLGYAVTPRFAPTSTEDELMVAGKLLKEFPDVYLQTHLSENKQEVAWVKQLFPWSRSYLDVYNHYGLVTKKSIFAHSIHLDEEDYHLLGRNKASVAFCPTSNMFLGSGLFNIDKMKDSGVGTGLGTDVGAGTSLSLLQTMGAAYKVNQLRKAFADNPDAISPLTPIENFYLATLGGARALSLDNVIGSFLPGMEADFIVLNPASGQLLSLREGNSTSIDDRLFAMEVLGDDRTVEHTYIMGKMMK